MNVLEIGKQTRVKPGEEYVLAFGELGVAVKTVRVEDGSALITPVMGWGESWISVDDLS